MLNECCLHGAGCSSSTGIVQWPLCLLVLCLPCSPCRLLDVQSTVVTVQLSDLLARLTERLVLHRKPQTDCSVSACARLLPRSQTAPADPAGRHPHPCAQQCLQRRPGPQAMTRHENRLIVPTWAAEETTGLREGNRRAHALDGPVWCDLWPQAECHRGGQAHRRAHRQEGTHLKKGVGLQGPSATCLILPSVIPCRWLLRLNCLGSLAPHCRSCRASVREEILHSAGARAGGTSEPPAVRISVALQGCGGHSLNVGPLPMVPRLHSTLSPQPTCTARCSSGLATAEWPGAAAETSTSPPPAVPGSSPPAPPASAPPMSYLPVTCCTAMPVTCAGQARARQGQRQLLPVPAALQVPSINGAFLP